MRGRINDGGGEKGEQFAKLLKREEEAQMIQKVWAISVWENRNIDTKNVREV